MDYESALADLRRLAVEHVGEHLGPQLAALARRGFMLKPASDDAPPTGRCRAGGPALLEPGTPWPENGTGIPLSLIAVLDTDELAPWLGEELPTPLGLVNIFITQPDPQYADDPRFAQKTGKFPALYGYDDDSDRRIVLADPARAVEIPAPAPATVFGRRPLHAAPVLTLPSFDGDLVDPVLETLDYRADPEFDENDLFPPYERLIRDRFSEAWRDYCRHDLGFRREDGWSVSDQAFGWPYIDSWLMEEREEEYTHLLTLSRDVLWPYGDAFDRVMVPTSALRNGAFARVVYEGDGVH
ncbi:DUF1963 domain-containing protein [Streptomyces sp. NPDC048483]|uniref:DUF1963 domain-containing protein n=1 Tax=Streptomyces sp. NPDC048483 TaxID=3154927 RepID=UPI00344620C2